MNWTYLGIAALLPLTIALAATLLAGAIQAIRSNRQGGSSRVAFHRLLRTLALVFPLAFLVASLWEGRSTWRGLLGVALGHPTDQRAMGILRAQGMGFLRRDPIKAVFWLRKAANGGDAQAQRLLARILASRSYSGHDPIEALRWAELAAGQGETDAMLLAGDLNHAEHPVAAEAWYRRALESLRSALDRRDPQACLTYGGLLASGKGVPQDPVESLAWMQVAERRGLPWIQTLTIRITETQMSQAQREAAARRADALTGGSGR